MKLSAASRRALHTAERWGSVLVAPPWTTLTKNRIARSVWVPLVKLGLLTPHPDGTPHKGRVRAPVGAAAYLTPAGVEENKRESNPLPDTGVLR